MERYICGFVQGIQRYLHMLEHEDKTSHNFLSALYTKFGKDRVQSFLDKYFARKKRQAQLDAPNEIQNSIGKWVFTGSFDGDGNKLYSLA